MTRTGKVIVAVKSTTRSSGGAITRYIATAKLDREKERLEEGKNRELFSEHKDNLSIRQGEMVLALGLEEFRDDEVAHLVVSLEPSDYEHLAETPEERKEAFKAAIREAMLELKDELGARALGWEAGIHLNTDNPHAHVGIGKTYKAGHGYLTKLKHIPRAVLNHTKTGENGEKQFVTGRIAQVVQTRIETARLPTRTITVTDKARDFVISREISAGGKNLQGLTPHCQVIGKWILAEIEAGRSFNLDANLEKATRFYTQQKTADGRAELASDTQFDKLKRLHSLREHVAELDKAAAAAGQPPPKALLSMEDLKRIEGESVLGLVVLTSPFQKEPVHLTEEKAEALKEFEEARLAELRGLDRAEFEKVRQAYFDAPTKERREQRRAEVREETRALLEPPLTQEQVERETEALHAMEDDIHELFRDEPYLGSGPDEYLDKGAPTFGDIGGRADHEEPSHLREQGPLQDDGNPQWKEQFILGRALVASDDHERLTEELKGLKEHGDKRRFLVHDETWGRTRLVSAFDLTRRAEIEAGRKAYDRDIPDKEKREALKERYLADGLNKHEKGLRDHDTILQKIVRKTEQRLDKANTSVQTFLPPANELRRHCAIMREPLPTPLLSHEEVTRIQDRAVAQRNPERVLMLERIRHALAPKWNEPARTEAEAERLEGQTIVSRCDLAARTKLENNFERTRHLYRWEIEGEKQKVSLADVERKLLQERDKSRFFGKELHILPGRRAEAAREAERLTELRAKVITRIEERRAEIQTEVKDSRGMASALGQLREGELTRRQEAGLPQTEKTVTRHELSRIEQNAVTTKDPAMLRLFYSMEETYYEKGNAVANPERRLARMAAREELAKVSVQQAKEALSNFEQQKQFIPVVVKGPDGRDKTARLYEVSGPRDPKAAVISMLIENKASREFSRSVEQAVKDQHESLKQEYKNAQECAEVTRAAAARTRELLPSREIPAPVFTPKQINQLEMYAVRSKDPAEQTRLKSVINAAEREGRVEADDRAERPQQGVLEHRKTNRGIAESRVSGDQKPAIEHSPSPAKIPFPGTESRGFESPGGGRSDRLQPGPKTSAESRAQTSRVVDQPQSEYLLARQLGRELVERVNFEYVRAKVAAGAPLSAKGAKDKLRLAELKLGEASKRYLGETDRPFPTPILKRDEVVQVDKQLAYLAGSQSHAGLLVERERVRDFDSAAKEQARDRKRDGFEIERER